MEKYVQWKNADFDLEKNLPRIVQRSGRYFIEVPAKRMDGELFQGHAMYPFYWHCIPGGFATLEEAAAEMKKYVRVPFVRADGLKTTVPLN